MSLADLPAEPDVPGEGNHSWASQERQHPRRGPSGQIVYVSTKVEVARVRFKRTNEEVSIPSDLPIDVLLAYSMKGRLVGILYHYPVDLPPFEKAGNVNVFVDPLRRRRGFGGRLVREALRRWPDLDLSQQNFTAGGLALVRSVLEEIG